MRTATGSGESFLVTATSAAGPVSSTYTSNAKTPIGCSGRSSARVRSDTIRPLGVMPLPKMSFSCAGCQDFVRTLGDTDLGQVVLVGIETHICVSQTAHYLLEDRVPVIIGADAVGARKSDMHEIGLARMGAAGAVLAHTESIAYEWLKSAEHPKFREALQIVKKYA